MPVRPLPGCDVTYVEVLAEESAQRAAEGGQAVVHSTPQVDAGAASVAPTCNYYDA